MMGGRPKSRQSMSSGDFRAAVRAFYGQTLKRRSDGHDAERTARRSADFADDEAERTWRQQIGDEFAEQTAAEFQRRLLVGRQQLIASKPTTIPIDESSQRPLVLPEGTTSRPKFHAELSELLAQERERANGGNPRTSTPLAAAVQPPMFAPTETPIPPANPPALFAQPAAAAAPLKPTALDFSPVKTEDKSAHSSVMFAQPPVSFTNTPAATSAFSASSSLFGVKQEPPEEAPVPRPRAVAVQPSASPVARERRLSKSETPRSSEFTRWVASLLKTHDGSMAEADAFRRDPAMKEACLALRIKLQQTIDVLTSSDLRDTAQALNSFNELFDGRIDRAPEKPPLQVEVTERWRVFLMLSICERYLKRMVNDEQAAVAIAQLFAVLIKQRPELFAVFLCCVFSQCVLPRLDARECLTRISELADGAAEDVTVFVATETARFKLLAHVCAVTPSTDERSGVALLFFLADEALNSPLVPIATAFVLSRILAVAGRQLRAKNARRFADVCGRARALVDADWPQVIRDAVDAAPELGFAAQSKANILVARNNAMLQQLRSTLAALPH
ncbi:hypothetical protein M3Y99_01703700 [Aphelenchoides fujianensis]|nr:hypothetical protein M3Y99_01703700 [Aphelenchoides fujianensis]